MASFIKRGSNEIEEASARSGMNTSRFLSPGKDKKLHVVPLVDLEVAGDNDVIIAYPFHKIWWEQNSVKERKTELEAEGNEQANKMFMVTEFPKLCNDPDIDPGTWLREHPEVFEGTSVEASTRYRKPGDSPITSGMNYLLPALWVNDPDLEEGQEAFEVKMLKFHQSSIFDNFKTIYQESGGIFKGTRFSITINEDGNSYNVVNLGEYKGYIPELDIDAEEFIGLTRREEIVERLELYGVTIPPVPENKKAILAAMQGDADNVEEIPDDEDEDEWEE